MCAMDGFSFDQRNRVNEMFSDELAKESKYSKIMSHYGFHHQVKKFNEEAYELEEAILTGGRQDVLEEIADCTVLLRQFKQLFCVSDAEIDAVAEIKANRQLKSMEAEK